MQMPEWGTETPVPSFAPAGGIAVVRFADALCASSSLVELARTFLGGFSRLVGVSMSGYALLDASADGPVCVANGNVSDVFVARYERKARDVDPLIAHVYETGESIYNMAVMSSQEWEESAVYRHAYRLHEMRHVVEVPVTGPTGTIGNLHFASSDPAHDFGPLEVRLAEALGGLIGLTIARIEATEHTERQRDEALAALELSDTAVVFSDRNEVDLRLNDSARRLLADVVESEERLHALLARPPRNDGFSRHVDVELTTGEAAMLHAASTPLARDPGALVTVLSLQRERPGIAPSALAVLTPREAEVATLVVEGLADREIATALCLSHHTVSQYVKRIYRKLNVGSRVALTRLLLTGGGAVRIS
jgi:DNA-binding CsgD family transcriptional regulator/GAF domain-containing protein